MNRDIHCVASRSDNQHYVPRRRSPPSWTSRAKGLGRQPLGTPRPGPVALGLPVLRDLGLPAQGSRTPFMLGIMGRRRPWLLDVSKVPRLPSAPGLRCSTMPTAVIASGRSTPRGSASCLRRGCLCYSSRKTQMADRRRAVSSMDVLPASPLMADQEARLEYHGLYSSALES